MDKIILKGLRVQANHGVYPSEKEQGQPFELDLTLYADLHEARHDDDLAKTINYADVAALVQAVMQEQSCDLIEHAAQRVAKRLLDAFPILLSVDVTLKKPQAPIEADFAYVAVAISESR